MEKLLEACHKGDFKTALQLISQGADPKSARDRCGWTPLHCACQEGNLNFINTLVEKHSCDVECKTSGDYFDVRLAECIQLAECIHTPCGSTPLHVACRYVIDVM